MAPNDETVIPAPSVALTVILPSETNPQTDSLSGGNIMIRDIQQYNGGHPTMHDGQQFNMALPPMHDGHQYNGAHPPMHDSHQYNGGHPPMHDSHQYNMGHQMRDGQQFSDADDIPPPKADFSAPPPYEVATKLPTYEEVQREKTLQGEHTPHTTRVPLAFLAIDTDAQDGDNENGLLGTDFMFFTAFLVAFLFNWIGFLLLMCFCHTIAARYGALSGFGLSLAKWTLIVKHSTDLASHENSWLWWLIMAFGLLICIRAIIQYLNIKRGWRLLSGSAQERLLFFY